MAASAQIALAEKGSLRALGAFSYGSKIHLIFQSKNQPDTYGLAESDDGFDFSLISTTGRILYGRDQFDIEKTDTYRFSTVDRNLYATFLDRKVKACPPYLATLKTLETFEILPAMTGLDCPAVILSDTKSNGEYAAYCGDGDIKIAFSQDLVRWQIQDEPLLAPRKDSFDSGPLSLQNAHPTRRGILLLYHSLVDETPIVGAAIFDKDDPDVLLWRSRESLWKPIPQWNAKKLSFIGSVDKDGKIISYWQVMGEGIYAIAHLLHENDISVQSKNISLSLDKPKTNPLISPKSENKWEAFTTFNPAAIYENGKVHILYRAQGFDYTSVVGYASSADGLSVDERHDKPCYVPKESFEATGNPSIVVDEFTSGGGYGGCEDPRLTRIGDRIYMTYVAFNGWSEPRIALTSISVEDFLNHRWFWEKPVLISSPGIIDKSAVIFPEKVNGKYVILHRVFPDILMDFVDSLEFDGSTWLKGEYRIKIRPDHWDSRKIVAGAPPIKTDAGWLLIYYTVDERDDRRYKIGAMLLDLADPRIVLHRTINPILEPNERYENEGFKAGVAYPCGAVVIRERLFVYYGGADTVVCVATAHLPTFLADLRHENLARLDPAFIKRVI